MVCSVFTVLSRAISYSQWLCFGGPPSLSQLRLDESTARHARSIFVYISLNTLRSHHTLYRSYPHLCVHTRRCMPFRASVEDKRTCPCTPFHSFQPILYPFLPSYIPPKTASQQKLRQAVSSSSNLPPDPVLPGTLAPGLVRNYNVRRQLMISTAAHVATMSHTGTHI